MPLLLCSLTGNIPEALADLIYLTSVTLRSNMLTVRAEKAGQVGGGAKAKRSRAEAERSGAEEREANRSRTEEGAGAKRSRTEEGAEATGAGRRRCIDRQALPPQLLLPVPSLPLHHFNRSARLKR